LVKSGNRVEGISEKPKLPVSGGQKKEKAEKKA
jgi:hypothetical protein